MITEIKANVNKLKGKKIEAVYNLGRNKTEDIEGVISNTFNAVFIVETSDGTKSFSYVDVLSGILKIKGLNVDK